ncbi:LysR family transcriptional regulator [Phenylobacterium sp.]|uniref:LysR family transcriptional regulator n=1 Tax=Phenylobacterium sp. TaxID=1871053 RepID=UPI002F42F294
MFDLNDIQAFAEVVESGGFGRAGQRLGLSKSMVSRRVARLEGELGAKLLSRTTRGVLVTEAGLAFKVHADRVIADLDAARDAIASQGDQVVGTLRVAAPLSFGLTHLAPVLAELAMRHPDLKLEASYSDRFVDLIGERFDVAVRVGFLVDSSLIARRIAPINAAAVASPGYLARFGAPATPSDLAHHPALTQGDEVWRFRDGEREIVVRPQGRFRADNGQALLDGVIAGLGVAVLPTFLASPALESGQAVPLLPDYPIPQGGLYVVRPPPAGPATRKVRALTDLLVERFGGEPYWDGCYAARKAAGAGAGRLPA